MSQTFKAELVEALKPLRGFARTFHRDPARADDLVQETVMKAWENREKFREGTNMRAWLFTILRNSYYSEMRKKTREVEDADGALTAALSEKGGQEGHMAMRDFRLALAELSDDQREALILVGASGFTYEEAAQICNCKPGTVKSRVSRARERLSQLLDVPPGDAVDHDAAPGATGADRAAQAF
ncbi:MAG TPA: sigma-70 family RNA polymerase sigma factor [Thermohalobaculum sp.]|nr:sigma-70 family RNA polymerase sigma factor [Thermohalobaculum sp.]